MIDRLHKKKSMSSTQSHEDKVNLTPNLLPYPHHVAAPKITEVDLSAFNRLQAHKVTKSLQKRAKEISMLVKTLQEDYALNLELYSATRSFEPVLGEVYHLYEKADGSKFLSLIAPTEWSQKYLYSGILNSDGTWSKVQ
jgi:Protein of unknown function (DUF2452)